VLLGAIYLLLFSIGYRALLTLLIEGLLEHVWSDVEWGNLGWIFGLYILTLIN